ncbi:MAG TPA: enterotoxin, partial [Rhodanobacteraceae bacterium]|nr:enterotoxin [Rhodanobacteraceae bacterium]
ARSGQLRRDFAAYLERERAHPYRPFLHYNSWYDIGYFTPYTEAQALERIHSWCRELVQKRGVTLDSFLFDDGWDDRSASWNFSKDFPHGFVPLKQAAAQCGAAPGIWLSPWGGYGKPHDQRIANGKKAGYGIVDDGLALSAPKYWQRFHQVVMQLLEQNGINQFKFDGTGNVNSVFPGSRFDSDFAAAIQLIDDIRAAKPGTFINLTTGTWASPFWLRWADSIWRDGYDHNFTGVGTSRERWITYRDRETYRNIVEKGPLFPLNSLMLHGIIYAQHARGLDTDPGHDFANEVRSYFATGTQLQELYITPSLLTEANWDALASAAKWARSNADVLKDNHWVGGDPGRLDVYGWAGWTPAKAIITFRNPADKPQLAVLDLDKQLELPATAARRYRVRDVWQHGDKALPSELDAGQLTAITLAPFAVLTLELTPLGNH